MLLRIAQRPVYIDAMRIINAAMHIADSENLTAKFMQQACRDAAHVAKALNHHGTILRAHPQVMHRLKRYILYTARGPLQSSLAAADGKRFPVHHRPSKIAFITRQRTLPHNNSLT